MEKQYSIHMYVVASGAGATRLRGICRNDHVQQSHTQVSRGSFLQRWSLPHNCFQCGKQLNTFTSLHSCCYKYIFRLLVTGNVHAICKVNRQ